MSISSSSSQTTPSLLETIQTYYKDDEEPQRAQQVYADLQKRVWGWLEAAKKMGGKTAITLNELEERAEELDKVVLDRRVKWFKKEVINQNGEVSNLREKRSVNVASLGPSIGIVTFDVSLKV
jgi:hypothetical protein